MYGLAVIIILYFYVKLAMWVAKKLVIKRESNKWKWGIRASVALIFILIPTADSILGHIYFSHLCGTESGVKIYQTVELPAEYWDEKGMAKFYKGNGDLDLPLLKNRFEETSSTNSYSSLFGIDETHQQLVDKSNKTVLGEVVSFMYWGGWFSRNFTPHDSAMDCKELHGNLFWHEFYVRFFKPAVTSK